MTRARSRNRASAALAHIAAVALSTRRAKVSPGYVRTDLTGGTGVMTPAEGARLPVRAALTGAEAGTGRFVVPDGPTPW